MKFWKVLSAAALVAGLAPYKVEKDEETGKTTYQSLLMRITTAPGKDEDKKQISVDLGEGALAQKVREKAAEREEAHLFTDDLAVTYQPVETEEAAQTADAEAAEAEIGAMAAEAAEAEIGAMAAEAAEAEIGAMAAEAAAQEAEAASDSPAGAEDSEEATPEEP